MPHLIINIILILFTIVLLVGQGWNPILWLSVFLLWTFFLVIRFPSSLRDFLWKFTNKEHFYKSKKLEEIAEKMKTSPEKYSIEEVLTNENEILMISRNGWRAMFSVLLIVIFYLLIGLLTDPPKFTMWEDLDDYNSEMRL